MVGLPPGINTSGMPGTIANQAPLGMVNPFITGLPMMLAALGQALAPEGSPMSRLGGVVGALAQGQAYNQYLERKRLNPSAQAPVFLPPQLRMQADNQIAAERQMGLEAEYMRSRTAQGEKALTIQERGLTEEAARSERQHEERMTAQAASEAEAERRFQAQMKESQRRYETDIKQFNERMEVLRQNHEALMARLTASAESDAARYKLEQERFDFERKIRDAEAEYTMLRSTFPDETGFSIRDTYEGNEFANSLARKYNHPELVKPFTPIGDRASATEAAGGTRPPMSNQVPTGGVPTVPMTGALPSRGTPGVEGGGLQTPTPVPTLQPTTDEMFRSAAQELFFPGTNIRRRSDALSNWQYLFGQ